ncbi:MAG: MYG1 family protein, partial [Nanoarchaeota archaeon]|nr:MYG1 family protein [Nanoarchaeota archaeon]
MKIVAHDGIFHGDEIFALAVLKLIYPDAEIIRTRDEKVFSEADLLIDVGIKFDNEKLFDHHQLDFKEKRKNGIPYASAGLIWRKFYNKITNEKVYNYLDRRIFEFIDAEDSGIRTFESKQCETYTVSNIINGMNGSEKSDKVFFEVLNFVIKLLSNEIYRAEKLFEAEEIIKEKLKLVNEEYLVLEKYIPWENWLVGNPKIKFVICQGEGSKDWCSCAVPANLEDFEKIAYFPTEWAGLTGRDLERVTGVDGAVFCHKH